MSESNDKAASGKPPAADERAGGTSTAAQDAPNGSKPVTKAAEQAPEAVGAAAKAPAAKRDAAKSARAASKTTKPSSAAARRRVTTGTAARRTAPSRSASGSRSSAGTKSAPARTTGEPARTTQEAAPALPDFTAGIETAMRFGHETIVAAIASQQAAVRAFGAIGAGLAAFSQRAVEESAAAARELAESRSLNELLERQVVLSKRGVETLSAEAEHLNSLCAKAAREAMEPLARQLVAAAELFGLRGT